jgi:hypothetical protein
MKTHFALILSCFVALVSAQEIDIDAIAKSEMRLASKK